jgi:transposase
MESLAALFGLPGFYVASPVVFTTQLVLHAYPLATTAACPRCQHPSSRVHSRHRRTLRDLPLGGRSVILYLHLRRFRCRHPACPTQTFVEQYPRLSPPHAQRTARLAQVLTQMAFTAGAESGSRLSHHLACPVSPDTLLRLMRAAPLPARPIPRILGVDDFAFRKGRTYGTILVNLQTHRPIDLLPDRAAATLATWLQAHPGVQLISRDRSKEYKAGATWGAPGVPQVADRFHLIHNWREALERLLDRYWRHFRGIHLPPQRARGASPVRIPCTAQRVPAARTPNECAGQVERHAVRHQRYEEVCQLHVQGYSIRAIAQRLHLSRSTVYHYLRSDGDPTEWRTRAQASALDPYIPYLYGRWQAGCYNGVQLWREIRAHGYEGTRKMVAVWVSQQRQAARRAGIVLPPTTGRPPKERPPVQPRDVTPRQVSYLLIARRERLTPAEQTVLTQVQERLPLMQTVYDLSQGFVRLVRERAGQELDEWLARAQASTIRDVRNFADGIGKDKAAVAAGLTQRWSNGPVEGQVNRLKCLKRQMYGRAKFDLLRRRVLADP